MQGETVQRRYKTKRVVGDLGTSLKARSGVLAPRTDAAIRTRAKPITTSRTSLSEFRYSGTRSANFFDILDY
jgi:hypothetical protein